MNETKRGPKPGFVRRDEELRGIVKKGRKYWYKRTLSPRLAAAINNGKREKLWRLDTKHLTIAIQRAAKIKATFEAVDEMEDEQQTTFVGKDLEAIMTHALELAADPPMYSHDGDRAGEVASEVLSDMAEKIEETHGLAVAKAFYSVAAGDKHTLASVVEMYIREKPLGPDQQRRLRWAVKRVPTVRFLEDVKGKLEAGQIITNLITKTNLSRSSVSALVKALSAIWNFAASKGLIKENVFHRPGVSLGDRTKKRPVTREELSQLVASPRDLRERRMASIFRLICCTGMRVGEACALKRQDVVVDGLGMWLFVATERGKTINARRKVFVAGVENQALINGLLLGRDPSPPEALLIGIGKGTLSARIKVYATRVLGETTVKGFLDTHSGRRTFAMACEAARLDDVTIKRMIGHSAGLPLWASTYSSGAQDVDLKESFERVERWLSAGR